jgi:fructose-bisphosphate aldolase class II
MIKHAIIFNIREGMTHEECVSIMALGKQQLSLIPGVTGITSGIAVNGDQAKYKYYFVVDFADESVIESYKYHPIHVRYADDYFRPMAQDRITTNYIID